MGSHKSVRLVILFPFSFFLAPCCALAAGKLEFNRDIRPILVENCFACHGPDKNARKAGLRLDVREEAVGMEAIVPGKPDKSHMTERIFSDDPKHRMPPPKSHKSLTMAQKEILRRWIAEGAEYQPHWSLVTPKRPPLPEVQNGTWVRNPLDRFVLAELEKRNLTANGPASKHDLLRRATVRRIIAHSGINGRPAGCRGWGETRRPS